MGTIRVAGLVSDSIVDGPGIRYAIFTQGCAHNCSGCHNPVTHDFNSGVDINIDKLIKQIVNNPLLSGVTLTGGDPFYQVDATLELTYKLKSFGINIIAYTGFTYEELLKMKDTNPNLERLLHNIDVLVDGPYDENLRDLTLHFRGSSNQRIIDVPTSIKNHSVCLLNW